MTYKRVTNCEINSIDQWVASNITKRRKVIEISGYILLDKGIVLWIFHFISIYAYVSFSSFYVVLSVGYCQKMLETLAGECFYLLFNA